MTVETEGEKAASSLVSLTCWERQTTSPPPPPLFLAKPLAMNYGAATITANWLDEKQALPHLPLCVSLCLNSRFWIIVCDQLAAPGQSR